MTERKHEKPRRRPGRIVTVFLLANALPLGVGAWLVARHLSGDLPPIHLPEGTGFNLGVLAACVVALVLVATLSLPVAHRAVSRSEEGLRRSRDVLRGRLGGSRLLALSALPLLAVSWFVAALVRLLLILAAVAVLAVSLLFLARLLRPGLGQEWIEKVLAWKPL